MNMKRMCVAVCCILATTALPRAAWAFLPWDCVYSEYDFTGSDAVVIGRVTKVERVTTKQPFGEETRPQFCYIATITVGQVLRGPVKKDSDLFIHIGEYVQRTEDNTVPAQFGTCNTHRALPLQINSVYLLCLRRGEGHAPRELSRSWRRKLWAPNCCHYSIHEIIWWLSSEKPTGVMAVLESQGMGRPKPPVPLADFLGQKMGPSDPEKAGK